MLSLISEVWLCWLALYLWCCLSRLLDFLCFVWCGYPWADFNCHLPRGDSDAFSSLTPLLEAAHWSSSLPVSHLQVKLPQQFHMFLIPGNADSPLSAGTCHPTVVTGDNSLRSVCSSPFTLPHSPQWLQLRSNSSQSPASHAFNPSDFI